jgi:hypothetical protein
VLTTAVAWTSLVLSVLSFLLFVVLGLRSAFTRAPRPTGAGDAVRQSGIEELAKAAEAFAKLADSLSKAGPGIAALVASIFFMLIARLGAVVIG